MAVFDVVIPSIPMNNVQMIQGDITNSESFKRALESSKAAIVFHIASIIDLRPVPSPQMRRVNVGGTRVVVNECRKSKYCKTLVYTSSIEVVAGTLRNGEKQKLNGCDETVEIPEHHFFEYAATKAAAEKLVLEADEDEGTLRTCAIRPGFILGINGVIGHQLEMQWAAQRYNCSLNVKLPVKVSCVNATNCADLHIVAAMNIEQSHGQAFFARDFDFNAAEIARDAFQDTTITQILLPMRLVWTFCFLLHLWEKVLHFLFNLFGLSRHTSRTVIAIEAVEMSMIDVMVSSRKAHEMLGWRPLRSQAETMDECREHANQYWCSLVGPEKAFRCRFVGPRVSGMFKSS